MNSESEIEEIKICPICGQTYSGHPAVSRVDNETEICSDCGTRQALESLGIDPTERDEILRIIHSHMK